CASLQRGEGEQRTSASECNQRRSPTARLRTSLQTAARSAITARRSRQQPREARQQRTSASECKLRAGAVGAARVGAGAAALLDALAQLLAGAVAAHLEVVAGDAQALGEPGGGLVAKVEGLDDLGVLRGQGADEA